MGDFPQDSIKGIRHLYRYLINYIRDCFEINTFTMANKTLLAPIISSPDMTISIETINLSSGNVTLSNTQKKASVLVVSAAHATNAIIAPSENRMYWVVNADGSTAAKIKKSGGTGVSIAAGKTALVYFNGSDYAKLTADQTIA